jgi:hypothetical protein
MSNTIYVYDEKSGRIKYTIDDASPLQIQNFTNKPDMHFYVGPSGQRLAGTFVKKDPSSGKPIGVAPIEHMSFLTINKHTIIANGKDEAVITGLRLGMEVDVNHETKFTVSNKDEQTLELSCNNYSYIPEQNKMAIYFKAYGCHDSVIKIDMIQED